MGTPALSKSCKLHALPSAERGHQGGIRNCNPEYAGAEDRANERTRYNPDPADKPGIPEPGNLSAGNQGNRHQLTSAQIHKKLIEYANDMCIPICQDLTYDSLLNFLEENLIQEVEV